MIWLMDFHLLCPTVNYNHNSLCNSNCLRLASGSPLTLTPVSFWHPPIPQLVFECFLAVYYKMSQAHLVNSLSYTGISHLTLDHFSGGWYLETIWYNSVFQHEVSVDKARIIFFKNIGVHIVSDSNFIGFLKIFSLTLNIF